ncbi:hypothetical protein CHISP_0915 [Chitinispirillum alkaliphilum]|nr:hypothetical protein CHISP_0915 [Chitinispirillum alkaliphilum]
MDFRTIIFVKLVICAAVAELVPLGAQVKDIRDRGERFYNCRTANTTAQGDIWFEIGAVGHVWDESPINLDSIRREKRRWVSNARAFPEARLRVGVLDFCSFTLESRPLSWAFSPGSVSGELKLTLPDNDNIRFSGTALSLGYVHNFTEGPPTIGGYRGFMPDGYVLEGGAVEGRLIHEIDFIARHRRVPLRLITNLGLRMPLERDMRTNYQYLIDAGIIYSAYDFDLFVTYSLQAFQNFLEPKEFEMGDKRWLVYFTENPSYLTLGGNVRYPGGAVLSVSLPLLLSVNQQSGINREHLKFLNDQYNKEHNKDTSRFADEVRRGIKDPFDPWFVKWKIDVSLTIPIRHRRNTAEMLRSYMLLKKKREPVRIDFDERLQTLIREEVTRDENLDAKERLQEIQRRIESISDD